MRIGDLLLDFLGFKAIDEFAIRACSSPNWRQYWTKPNSEVQTRQNETVFRTGTQLDQYLSPCFNESMASASVWSGLVSFKLGPFVLMSGRGWNVINTAPCALRSLLSSRRVHRMWARSKSSARMQESLAVVEVAKKQIACSDVVVSSSHAQV